MITATQLSATSLSAGILQANLISGGDTAYRLAFIGDSTTQWGFIPRFFGVIDIISDAAGVGGDGELTLYNDSTMRWTAEGDTVGARTAFDYDFRCWFESGTADKGVCITLPSAYAEFGTPEGTPIPLTMNANDGMGGRDEAPYVFGQILNGQRFAMVSNQGVAGQTSTQILARFSDILTKDTFGRPLSIKPTHVVILAGINDPNTEAAQTISNLTDMRDLALSAGVTPIFGNLVMESPDVDDAAFIAAVNAGIAGMGVMVADYHTACNGVAGAISGPHYTTLGGKLAGAPLAALLESIAGQGSSRFAFGSGTTNLVVNGALSGTSGVLTGMTGVAAVDSTFSGIGVCIASKESVTGEHDWQVFTVTGAVAGATIEMELDPSWVTGQSIFGAVDCDITGDGISNANFTIEFRSSGDTRVESFYALNPISDHDMGELAGILQTPDIEVPTYYNAGRAYASVILSTGNTVVKFRNAGVGLAV